MPTLASLSLDLDNKWAYLRTHGIGHWQEYPTYLPLVCARVVELWERYDVKATVFVVGRDLLNPLNVHAIGTLAALGYEMANHSYSHYPWMERLADNELEREVADSEIAIQEVCGVRPHGFRAPGFSVGPRLLSVLAGRGYRYDASAFPTSIGPLAARYARLKSFGDKGKDAPRQEFAPFSSGWGTLHPHLKDTARGTIAQVPVTTMPFLRLPFHVTYLMYLAQFSLGAAQAYLRSALALCRWRRVAPSMLLHPLDFLGGEEEPELAFFPGMRLAWRDKQRLLDYLLEQLLRYYRVVCVGDHAAPACGQQGQEAVEEVAVVV